MSTRPSLETYHNLIDAYRMLEGRSAYTEAAQWAGTSVQTARKAWNEGWPGLPFMPAIKEQFAKERVKARAVRRNLWNDLLEKSAKDAQHATEDGAMQSALEALHARTLLITSDLLTQEVAGILKDSIKGLREKLRVGLSDLMARDGVHPNEILTYVERMAELLERSAKISEKVQVIEGKRAGKPDLTVSIGKSDPDMAAQEVLDSLFQLRDLLSGRRIERADGGVVPAVFGIEVKSRKVIDVDTLEAKIVEKK